VLRTRSRQACPHVSIRFFSRPSSAVQSVCVCAHGFFLYLHFNLGPSFPFYIFHGLFRIEPLLTR